MPPQEAIHCPPRVATIAVQKNQDGKLLLVSGFRDTDVIGPSKVSLLRPRLRDEVLAGR